MNDIEKLSNAILFNNQIDETLTQDTAKNINVYRNNYKSGMINIIKDKYPTVVKVLETNFNYVANKYIENNISSSSNIDNYGDDFPGYLKEVEQLKSINFITYIAQIDLLVFTKKETSIQCPKGSLDAYRDINKKIYDSILIDETKIESIELIFEDKSYYLKTKS